MYKSLLSLSLLLLIAPGPAQDKTGKIPPGQDQDKTSKFVKETWDAAYCEGVRAGYVHYTVRQDERDGQKVLTATLEQNLIIKRYGGVVNLRVEAGDVETADGKILEVFMTQHLDKGKPQEVKGVVKGGQLHLQIGAKQLPPRPWDGEALSMIQLYDLPRKRKLKPGDSLEVLVFEPTLWSPIKAKLDTKDTEEVDILDVANPNAPKPSVERITKKLLRAELQMGKIKVGATEVELPKQTYWLDSNYEPLRSQMDVPGIGAIILYRTTEALAKQEGVAPHLMPDYGLNNLVKLAKPIEGFRDAKAIVYRITVKDDPNPATVFSQDARQRVLSKTGSTIDLEVKALKNQDVTEKPGEANAEFLKSSFFLDSDSDVIKERAARIVGDETDAWKKALRIEKWVRQNMTGDSGVGYVKASQIARDLKGDCRQHGMLTAALCRAAGIPSRTALGLVYVEHPRHGPFLGFHLWTEVWLKGQWLSLDATLGQGGIGPGHLKITDHSWSDTQTLAPLLPVVRAMGKIKVESVRVE